MQFVQFHFHFLTNKDSEEDIHWAPDVTNTSRAAYRLSDTAEIQGPGETFQSHEMYFVHRLHDPPAAKEGFTDE